MGVPRKERNVDNRYHTASSAQIVFRPQSEAGFRVRNGLKMIPSVTKLAAIGKNMVYFPKSD